MAPWSLKIALSEVALLLCAGSAALAQHGGKAEPLRIELKPGTYSRTVTGQVRGSEEYEYVFAARKGQRLFIKLTSVPRRSSVFELKAPDHADLGLEYDANWDYHGTLPVSGDYFISVSRPTTSKGTSRFTLTITLR